MKCQKCGTECPDGNLFCEACGAELETPVLPENIDEKGYVKKEKRPRPKKTPSPKKAPGEKATVKKE
ncbi:MAG: zinc ribbon domain-containing protein, partial [Ruminococcus sp.]|nr:zinc ribbon domain-containing protein [Ruminococcus sp.]